MPTLSWGASLDSLLADTPQKEMPFVFGTLVEDVKACLNEAFSSGTTPADDMPSLCELVLNKLAEFAGSTFEALPGDAGDMAKELMRCLQLHERAGTAAKALRAEEKEMRGKMANADQAVAKALQSVIQQSSVSASAAGSQVAEKMAFWKKGIQDAAAKKVAAAEADSAAALKEFEEGMKNLVRCAHAAFLAGQPKSQDELLAAMMEQVAQHMQQLEVGESGAGTGGTRHAAYVVQDVTMEKPAGATQAKDKAACTTTRTWHIYVYI